jgi:hypothetical protein
MRTYPLPITLPLLDHFILPDIFLPYLHQMTITKMFHGQVNVAETLRTSIREIPGSNLDRFTDYPTVSRGFPPYECRKSTPK